MYAHNNIYIFIIIYDFIDLYYYSRLFLVHILRVTVTVTGNSHAVFWPFLHVI